MNESLSQPNQVEALAEEFLERRRQGERPTIAEYTAKYPELAEEIRACFPALLLVEDLKPDAADLTGPATTAAGLGNGMPGGRLGDYRLLREVGRGGMGVVYEAEQEALGRHVALKVLPAQALLDPRHVQRFQREAKAAARLHHTNIVPVFGVGEDAGLHYYVMQFIHGLGLDQVLDELKRLRRGRTGATEAGPPAATERAPAAQVAEALLTGQFSLAPGAAPPAPLAMAPSASDSSTAVHLPGQDEHSTLSGSGRGYWQSVARVGVQVAEALAHAHAQGVLHRDIKPSNLLLDMHGTVWVTDFGLAKADGGDGLTQTGDIVGTLRYMAPERFGGTSDPRSDLYGLGVTLYELLTLRPAFAETDHNQLLQRVLHEEPPRPRRLNPEVPRDLETVVLKAIAKEPKQRYASGAEMAEDLRRFLADRPVRARRASAWERLWRWCRRNPAVAAAAAVAAGALVAVTVVSLVFAAHAGRAAENLRHQQDLTEAALADVKIQRNTAQERTRVAERRLAENYLERGLATCELEGDPARGMLWFARALAVTPDDTPDLERTIRANLAGWRSTFCPVHAILPHPPAVLAVAFSPDGQTIVTGGVDSAARLWDTATGKPRGRLLTHPRGAVVTAVAFRPDGKAIVTAGGDRTARLWDAVTGEPLGPPLVHPDILRAVAFRPDGRVVVTGCGDGAARLWDPATGWPLGTPLQHPAEVPAVAFRPDGKAVLTGCADRCARLWDADSGKALGTLVRHQGPVRAVAFRPDGKAVLTGSSDHTARLWDAATGQPLGPPLLHAHFVTAVAISPDGRTALTGCADGTARLWDAVTGEPASPPFRHQGAVRAVAFGSGGKTVLTGGEDQSARLWRMRPPQGPRWSWPAPTAPGTAAVSPDGRVALTTGRNGPRLWDAATGAPLGFPHALRVHQPLEDPVPAAFHPDRRTLQPAPGGCAVQLWDAAGKQPLGRPLDHPHPFEIATWNREGTRVLTADTEGIVRLWDTATGTIQGPPLRHHGLVQALALSPDGRTVLTGSRDHAARLWDAATGQPLTPPLRHQRGVASVAFRPDGRAVATWSSDGTARLWDAATGQPLGPPLQHPHLIGSLAFCPDGKGLLTVVAPRSDQEEGWKFTAPAGRPAAPAAPLQAQLWETPDPVAGPAERITLWVQVLSGMELDNGVAHMLDASTWEERWQRLEQRGGPPP